MSGFDSVARIYQTLERVAFGSALERARFSFVDRLQQCESVLILGDGDGRFLEAALRAAPRAKFVCVDSSRTMIDLASARVAASQRGRVTFLCTDARQFDPSPKRFDAIVTLFFLDCFTARDVRSLVAQLTTHLQPNGMWLFADFAIPSSGLARLHATLLVQSLYAFFRWQTAIEARELPPSEQLLGTAGLKRVDERAFRWGSLRSAVFQKAASSRS